MLCNYAGAKVVFCTRLRYICRKIQISHMIDHCLRVIFGHLVYTCMRIKNINISWTDLFISKPVKKNCCQKKKAIDMRFNRYSCISLYCIYNVIMYANFAHENKYSCQKWLSPTGYWIPVGFFRIGNPIIYRIFWEST